MTFYLILLSLAASCYMLVALDGDPAPSILNRFLVVVAFPTLVVFIWLIGLMAGTLKVESTWSYLKNAVTETAVFVIWGRWEDHEEAGEEE